MVVSRPGRRDVNARDRRGAAPAAPRPQGRPGTWKRAVFALLTVAAGTDVPTPLLLVHQTPPATRSPCSFRPTSPTAW